MCLGYVRSYFSSHPPTRQLTADAAQIVSAGLTARENAGRAPSVSNVPPRRGSAAPNAVSFERS